MNFKSGKWVKKKCPSCGDETENTLCCSYKCVTAYRLQLLFEKIDRGEYNVKPIGGNKILKRYLISRRGKQCEECKNVEWLGKEIPLTTHHIDGNACNNRPDNLKLLCWNCHALTENYGKKNKKSSRIDRYEFALLA